jgi:AmmeMemoRadiSam system protein A
MKLSLSEKKELLQIARGAITAAVKKETHQTFSPKNETLSENAGAFVTLTKNGHLRGCIGYTDALFPLFQTVSEAGVSAATKDYRFTPIEENELDNLDIEISVLSPLKRVENIDNIVVGRDGLFIEQGDLRGLLLPQVATEYSWGRKTFLEHTCQKAGLPSDAYKESETQIWSFEVIRFQESEMKKES